MRPICIVGAGGHGRTILDCFRSEQYCPAILFADDDVSLSARISGFSRTVFSELFGTGTGVFTQYDFIVAVGDPMIRRKLVEMLDTREVEYVNAIHSLAYISSDSTLGHGVAVMPFAMIGNGVRIGNHVIINNYASIGHDCTVRDGATVSDHSVFGGGVEIGECAHLGLNVTVLPKIKIGARAVIGAGAVVTKDVPAGTTVVGNPARELVKHAAHQQA